MSHYPEPWKEGPNTILRKPKRDNYSEYKAYRPISLLPVLGKVLERIMLRRFSYETDKRQVLHPTQFGFRKTTQLQMRF